MGEGRNIFSAVDGPLPHGGAIDAMRDAYPDAREPWIDLSTGISPFSYPMRALDSRLWSSLPQSLDEDLLLDAAANRYGCHDRGMVVAAPGTQAIIQVLPRMFVGARVAIVSPTYGEHAASWHRCGFDVFGSQNIDDAVSETPDVVVVVNPNNPTGHVYTGDELRAAANTLATRRASLVVDEAFVDLCEPGISLVPTLPDNAIVLRSFGKTFGLAGVRLGFAISTAKFSTRLRQELGPWAVSGPAIDIGRRALLDDDWFDTHRVRLRAQSLRLQNLLLGAGFRIEGATDLFVLGDIGSAQDVRERLAGAGVHVRHFADRPTWLRFGLPGAESAWRRLEDALFHRRANASSCTHDVPGTAQ